MLIDKDRAIISLDQGDLAGPTKLTPKERPVRPSSSVFVRRMWMAGLAADEGGKIQSA